MSQGPKLSRSTIECLAAVDVDQELSGTEDPHLDKEKLILDHYLEVAITKPPRISTLREWGKVVLTDGKHKGSTHAETFERDLSYSLLMAQKKSLTSPQGGSPGSEGQGGDFCGKASGSSAEEPGPISQRDRQRRLAILPKSGGGACQDHQKSGNDECFFGGTKKDELRPDEGGEGPHRDPRSATSPRTSSLGGGQLSDRNQAVDKPLLECETVSTEWENNVLICREINQKIREIERKLETQSQDQACDQKSKYPIPKIDVLEIGSGVGNMVTTEVKKLGRKAMWRLIHLYEPAHPWIDVRSPWKGDWKDWWPKQLLLDEYQIENGRHFHLCCSPQFFESTQSDLAAIHEGTLCAVHHLLALGKTMVLPGNSYQNRQTILITTSRQVHQALDTRQYIARISHKQSHKPDITKQTLRRQLQLNTCAARALTQRSDYPLSIEELLIGEGESRNSEVEHAQQVWKRRRLLGKQPPPDQSGGDEVVNWQKVFQMLNSRVARVGASYFEEGDPIVGEIQRLLPEFQVKHVVACRGTNRIRPPQMGGRHEICPGERRLLFKGTVLV